MARQKKEVVNQIVEEIRDMQIEEVESDDEVIEATTQKPKRVMSEKQKEAFEKCQKARMENYKNRVNTNYEKLIEHKKKIIDSKEETVIEAKKPKKKKKIIIVESSSDEEEEVQIIKKTKNPEHIQAQRPKITFH